jgi:small subunit ribosomal protein S20
MKSNIKKVDKATNKKEALRKATKSIGKAAKKGVIKKKTAARKVSRLAKKVNKA